MSNALCPRRLTHSLSVVGIADEGVDGSAQTLSARLWTESQDLAAAALESDFIQGIKNGSLNPNHYGQYTVQDAVYCHRGVEGWRSIASRATQPDFKTFAEARVKGWVSYSQRLFSEWHIADPTAIKLSPAIQAYAEFEANIAQNYDPHYAVVVMLPCDRLWYWLATQIEPDATEPNLYAFWMKENGSSDVGAKRLERFIDARTDSIDESMALEIYRTAMLCEVNGFRSAGKQTLID